MASKSLFQGVWTSIRDALSKQKYVGMDINGNRYYKWTEKLNGELVEKRRVKVPGGDFLYDPKIVPPEWRAWLAKTRQDPPSEEELARTAARAIVMRERVAAIEERERQRRYRMATLGQEAVQAGGTDMGRFMAQLENKGYGGSDTAAAAAATTGSEAQQQQQQQQQQPPPGGGQQPAPPPPPKPK